MAYFTYGNKEYNVTDTLEYVTLADSFVRNKIGTGHGEAKLYVGNESKELLTFFGDFNCKCFFKKVDFEEFLDDAKDEFMEPEQDYVKKEEMPSIYQSLRFVIDQINDDILWFDIYRVPVEPPRVYINCQKNIYYDLMRSLGLPNISYLSVLKLKCNENDETIFYFKIFIDYETELVQYTIKKEENQEEEIKKDPTINKKTKEALIKSRTGQGEFRQKLLQECAFCPFTMVSDERLLVASHIKPWYASDDKEKVDPKNGFLFTPTFGRLFERGFITFEDDKTLVVSPWISPINQKRLNIYTGKIIESLPLNNKRKGYLKFHREYIFKF